MNTVHVMAEDPTGRAFALLSMLTTGTHWSGSELAGRLGVTTRTVRRDVDRLRRFGYRVDASPGTDGGYRLVGGSASPPLFFDRDEAVAVVTALMTTTSGLSDTGAHAGLGALAKLRHVLPPQAQATAAAVQSSAQAVNLRPTSAVDPHHIGVLAECCRDAVIVRFAYLDRVGATSHRRVEPHALVTVRAAWYLVAFDLDRSDWRTFRLDRIDGSIDVSGHGFRRRPLPDGDASEFVGNSLASAPYAHRAVVGLRGDARAVANAFPWLNKRRVTVVGADRVEVSLGASDSATLVRDISEMASSFLVDSIVATGQLASSLRRLGATLVTTRDDSA